MLTTPHSKAGLKVAYITEGRISGGQRRHCPFKGIHVARCLLYSPLIASVAQDAPQVLFCGNQQIVGAVQAPA